MSDHTPDAPRIVIVDSSAILKSCFEGYPHPRSSSYKGKVLEVQALYGYMYRTMQMYERMEFEYLVHVMDPPGGSFYRYAMYPEYKDGRKEDDPTLAAQKALLKRTLEAFGERVLLRRGVEADDVIATLAERCYEMGYQVLIVSPDKDLMQMVSDEKSIALARYIKDPTTGRNEYSFYFEKEVIDTFGVRPEQVADFLAIVGDDADNIPGVHKAGPKTAATWLNQYGDLMSVMTNADQIKGKIGEYLQQALPHLPRDQKLTNVLRDVPDIGIPQRPEIDPANNAFYADLLQWSSDFPTRFSCAGVADPDQAAEASIAPPVSAEQPIQAPAQDHLANASIPEPSPVLGEWTGLEFDADPFEGLDSSSTAVVHVEVETVSVTVVETAPEPAPSRPSGGMRPGRVR